MGNIVHTFFLYIQLISCFQYQHSDHWLTTFNSCLNPPSYSSPSPSILHLSLYFPIFANCFLNFVINSCSEVKHTGRGSEGWIFLTIFEVEKCFSSISWVKNVLFFFFWYVCSVLPSHGTCPMTCSSLWYLHWWSFHFICEYWHFS